MAQAAALLAAETTERHRRAVVIEEAHLLQPDQLEELRPVVRAAILGECWSRTLRERGLSLWLCLPFAFRPRVAAAVHSSVGADVCSFTAAAVLEVFEGCLEQPVCRVVAVT
jgi:hypothetical protein